MSLLVPDVSLLHFQLLNSFNIMQNNLAFIRDKCCHLLFCLHLIEPRLLSTPFRFGQSALSFMVILFLVKCSSVDVSKMLSQSDIRGIIVWGFCSSELNSSVSQPQPFFSFQEYQWSLYRVDSRINDFAKNTFPANIILTALPRPKTN